MVIAIIGILSGLIVVSMSGVTQKANIAKAQVFSNSLRNSLMLNLIAEWKFDELTTATEGTSIQDSWGTNNGTLDTYVTIVDSANKVRTGTDCVSGNCLSFDGSDDYIDCGAGLNSAYGTKKLTISAWLYNKDTGNVKSILANRDTGSVGNIFLFKSATEKITFDLYNTAQLRWATNYSLPTNTWINLIITFDGTTTTLYINEVYKDSTTTQSTATFPGTSIYGTFIGRNSYDLSYFFNGSIDDIRIYNTSASISQIKEQFYASLNNLLFNERITKIDYLLRMADLNDNYSIR